MQETDLTAAISEVMAAVEPWDNGRFVFVKPLQEARRNHGEVVLMQDSAHSNAPMAVKRIPNRWLCSSPAEFGAHYPNASEKPWHDLGFVHHLAAAHFPYVCDIYAMFRSDEEAFVVYTHCESDLFAWTERNDVPAPGPAREEAMRPIVAQVCSGVRWLHNLGIAHRDLSLKNILLAGTGAEATVKIIDFGMATLKRHVRGEERGGVAFQAPEMHLSTNDVDTFLSDSFALGVVMFAMAAQETPWTCTKRGECQAFEYVSSNGFRSSLEKRRCRRGNGETLAQVMSAGLVQVIEALVQLQPEHRACVGEQAFEQEVQSMKRASAWSIGYLRGLDAGLSAGPAPPASPTNPMMKLFRRGPGSQPKVSGSKTMQEAELSSAISEVLAAVEPWQNGRFVFVKPLQEARRNHGEVVLMQDSAHNNAPMAVKRIPNRWLCASPAEFSAQYPNASEKPWHDLGFVHHLAAAHFPYVCDIYGVFRSNEESFVVYTHYDMDLFEWAERSDVPAPGPAREEAMRPILAQVFSGVRWLHNLGIAHRDLSLKNVLLAGAGAEVKIIDFGMATLKRHVRGEERGGVAFQAPEMHLSTNNVDTFLSDAFALGVVTFAMATQETPWTCTKRGECQTFEYVISHGFRSFLEKRRCRKGNGESLAQVMSAGLVEVIEALVHLQPEHRACVGEQAFEPEVQSKRRVCVWQTGYLAGLEN